MNLLWLKKIGHLANYNFITWSFYKDCLYWHDTVYCKLHFVFFLVQ